MFTIEEIKIWLDNINSRFDEFIGMKCKWDCNDIIDFLAISCEIEQSKIPYETGNYNGKLKVIGDRISEYIIKAFNKEDKSGVFPSVTQIINDISIEFIFSPNEELDLQEKLKIEENIDILQEIANKTYENKEVEMGILLCTSKGSIEKVRDNNEFDFLECSPQELKNFVYKQKPVLKLIDNKNFNLVLNCNNKLNYPAKLINLPPI